MVLFLIGREKGGSGGEKTVRKKDNRNVVQLLIFFSCAKVGEVRGPWTGTDVFSD